MPELISFVFEDFLFGFNILSIFSLKISYFIGRLISFGTRGLVSACTR